MASQINASNSGFGGIVSTGDSSGVLQLQTANTTAVTIDTSQNVGIGTTSPNGKFESYTNSGYSVIANSSAGSVAINPSSNAIVFGTTNVAAYATGNYDAATHVYKTSGTERMRIDTSGRVTTPYQPAFYGYRTAGNVSATTTVLHNVVVTNVGSCYNSGTGIFTCPVAGVYEIYAGGHGENSQPTVLDIQLNGTTVAQEYFNGALYGVNSLMAIISCAANDQIKSVVTTGTFWAGNISGLKMTVKLIG